MTEPAPQTNDTTPVRQAPQPTDAALRTLEEVRLLREKIARPVARLWGLFVADLKQGWNDLRGKPSGDFKWPVLKTDPKNTETLQEAVDRLDAAGELDPKFRKMAERALKREKVRTQPRVKKRTIARVAFGNFRHSWKDAFSGMKLRYFLIPNSKKMDSKRLNWTMAKATTSILGGAAIGGALGFGFYATPVVFLAAVYSGLPLLALGVGIRAIGVVMPKGELKNKVKSIGKKTFATGVICAMWPMVGVGAMAFGGLHAALTTAEVLTKGFGASLRAAVMTLKGQDVARPAAAPALTAPANTAPASDFAATAPAAGADFAQAAATAAAAEAQQSATPEAARTPASRKPR